MFSILMTNLSQHQLMKRSFPTKNCRGDYYKQVNVINKGLFLDFLAHCYICLNLCNYHTIFMYFYNKSGYMVHSPVLFFNISLAFLGSLHFCIHLRITLSIPTKNTLGLQLGFIKSIQINLRRTDILIILSLSIHKHSMPLGRSSLGRGESMNKGIETRNCMASGI